MLSPRHWLVWLLCAIVIVGGPVSARAQEDPIRLTQTIFSNEREIAMSYPFGWVGRDYTDPGSTSVVMIDDRPAITIIATLRWRDYRDVYPNALGDDPAEQLAARIELLAQYAPPPTNTESCYAGRNADNRTESYGQIETVTIGETTYAKAPYTCRDSEGDVEGETYLRMISDVYALSVFWVAEDLSAEQRTETDALIAAMINSISVNAAVRNAVRFDFDEGLQEGDRTVDPIFGETPAVANENFGTIQYSYPFGWSQSSSSSATDPSISLGYNHADGSDSLYLSAANDDYLDRFREFPRTATDEFAVPAPFLAGLDHAEAFATAWELRQLEINPLHRINQLTGVLTFELGPNTYSEILWFQHAPRDTGASLIGFGLLTLEDGSHSIIDLYSRHGQDMALDRFYLAHAQRRAVLATYRVTPYPELDIASLVPITPDNFGDMTYITSLPYSMGVESVQFLDESRVLMRRYGTYLVYDMATRSSVRIRASGENLHIVDPDTLLFVTQTNDAFLLQLWDTRTGERTLNRSFRSGQGEDQPDDYARSALSEDGETLAVTIFTNPYTIQLVDVRTGDRIGRLESGFASNTQSNYVIGGNQLYACLYNPGRRWIEFYVFNMTTFQRERNYLTDAGSCDHMMMAPDEASLIVAGRWALSGELFGRFTANNFATQWSDSTAYGNLQYTTDGSLLLAQAGDQLLLIDPITGARRDTLRIDGLQDIAFAPDGRYAMVAVGNGPLQFYGIRSGQ